MNQNLKDLMEACDVLLKAKKDAEQDECYALNAGIHLNGIEYGIRKIKEAMAEARQVACDGTGCACDGNSASHAKDSKSYDAIFEAFAIAISVCLFNGEPMDGDDVESVTRAFKDYLDKFNGNK